MGEEKNDEGYTDFAAVVDQEEFHVKILLTKLEQVQPTLVIVQGDVPLMILDKLREMNITVVSGLNHKKMNRIARYTQTVISLSPNILDPNFTLGKCCKFYIFN